jgi:hypothetical protein
MSIGRIGSRAAVVGLGILASTALAAGPSWAAKEPGLCAPGAYPGVLFAHNGSAFKNARACAKYVAKGGQLGGVDAVAEPPVGGSFNERCSGFGLEPSTATVTQEYRCGAMYSNGIFTGQYGPSSTSGTWSVSTSLPCTENGGRVVSIQVLVVDLDGSTVEREFPPPSGC